MRLLSVQPNGISFVLLHRRVKALQATRWSTESFSEVASSSTVISAAIIPSATVITSVISTVIASIITAVVKGIGKKRSAYETSTQP